MTPRSLHRWKSFWLGLLVLAFLGGAWVRSAGNYDLLIFRWNSRSLSIAVAQGGGSIGLISDLKYLPSGSLPIDSLHHPYDVKRWFPPAMQDLDCIAHWLLILGFLIPWAGFLVWRVRRVKRRNIEHRTPGIER
jgi:hypothetical protein